MNPSVCRSGKEVTSQCSQVMLSQHVSTVGLFASSGVPALVGGKILDLAFVIK